MFALLLNKSLGKTYKMNIFFHVQGMALSSPFEQTFHPANVYIGTRFWVM